MARTFPLEVNPEKGRAKSSRLVRPPVEHNVQIIAHPKTMKVIHRRSKVDVTTRDTIGFEEQRIIYNDSHDGMS